MYPPLGRRAMRGLTLIELMIGIAVAGVLLALAGPSFQAALGKSRLSSSASELTGAVQLARSEAIRNNRRVVLCRSTDGSACDSTASSWPGWLIFVDLDSDGVRDYVQVKGDGHIDAALADKALKMLDVDPIGLDLMDRKLLEAVIHRFDGGPVGLDNVAAAIGEESGTIEDVIEPYLIQQGYLQRTPRGRIATPAAWRHLGLVAPTRASDDLFEP